MNYLNHHIYPITNGWLNDPNGLCYFKGNFHIFYQEDKNSPYGKHKSWGHVITKDFIHYTYLGTPIKPDSIYDKDGAYSGCAYVLDDTLHIFYTGNVKHQGDYDYILEGREHNLVHMISKDGINFVEKKCIFKNEDYPSDLTKHVRDPQITLQNGKYVMVLGARDRQNLGCILKYQSHDLLHWEYVERYYPNQHQPYMLECPNMIDDTHIICSPQGLCKDEEVQNIYEVGMYTIQDGVLTNYQKLDYGFDFYAPQVFNNTSTPYMISWMGMPDAKYTNPTILQGWQHCLTLPRTYKVKKNHLYQSVISQIQSQMTRTNVPSKNMCLKATAEGNFDLTIGNIQITYQNQTLVLNLEKCGSGRHTRSINLDVKNMEIYVDTSCIEIFLNDGYAVLSSRYYDENFEIQTNLNYTLYNLPKMTLRNEE